MATLINGNGNPAIYAQQDADFYNGIMGPRTRILNVGSKMAATIEDANTIAIADGVIITKEGRRVQVDVGNVDEFIIPTGQAGTTRYYIIGYHLYTDGSANQLCETFVQLMASGSETITEDEFREGATEVYVSLYRIEQTGLTLNDPEALLTVGDSVSQIEDDIDDIEGDIAQINSDLTELKEDFSFYYEITTANTLYAQGIPLDVKYVLLDACYHNNGVHCFMLVPRNLITGITHLARVYTPGGWAELGWSSTQMQSGSLPTNYKIRVYTK